ncbi:hypothetical protein B0H11DRAFT_1354564 [Mycena galericulata]|nr:hypothetical protein B0H11DRAFT_1354564 [Mycena galericulata]
MVPSCTLVASGVRALCALRSLPAPPRAIAMHPSVPVTPTFEFVPRAPPPRPAHCASVPCTLIMRLSLRCPARSLATGLPGVLVPPHHLRRLHTRAALRIPCSHNTRYIRLLYRPPSPLPVRCAALRACCACRPTCCASLLRAPPTLCPLHAALHALPPAAARHAVRPHSHSLHRH